MLVLYALQGHVHQLSSNVNGNHVIQRCIQCFPETYCCRLYEEIVYYSIYVGRRRLYHDYQ